MRIQDTESLESWADRVHQHEYSLALKKLESGIPIDAVLERLSTNIVKKMLHPVIVELYKSRTSIIDVETSKKSYIENYINRVPRAPDHVED